MNTTKIPKLFHFIYLFNKDTVKFNINHRLSLESLIVNNSPKGVNLWTNNKTKLMESKEFQILRKKYPMVEVRTVDYYYNVIKDLTKLDPHQLPYMAHVADMLRLLILYDQGGAYFDVDVIGINPIPPHLWNSNKPVFWLEVNQSPGVDRDSLWNGMILSPKGSKFLSNWLSEYRSYRPEDCPPGTVNWTKYSVQLGYDLYEQSPEDIYVIEDAKLVQPFYLGYSDVLELFFLDRVSKVQSYQSYAVHLWETRHQPILKVLDKRYFKESDSTYAHLCRKYLENDPK